MNRTVLMALALAACSREKPQTRIILPAEDAPAHASSASLHAAAALNARPRPAPVAPELPAIGGPPVSLYSARLGALLSAGLPAPQRPNTDALMHLRVDATGQVTEAHLLRPSGDAAYDRAVEAAAARYAPGAGPALPVPGDEHLRDGLLSEGIVVHVHPQSPTK
jgi:hypothetical protein